MFCWDTFDSNVGTLELFFFSPKDQKLSKINYYTDNQPLVPGYLESDYDLIQQQLSFCSIKTPEGLVTVRQYFWLYLHHEDKRTNHPNKRKGY